MSTVEMNPCCRVLYLEKEVNFFPKEDWLEAHALIRIRSERKIRSTAVISIQTRYYISSTKKSAKELNEKVPDHVENKLHGSLDVTMNEDGDRK
jgi:predicted transposase YbfD/YdcC